MVGITGWWGGSEALEQAWERCLDPRRCWLLRQSQHDFLGFCTRRFLWKFEHSQLNTLAISIFHFDRGVFSLCCDG